jgi:hypothetical protein
MRVSVELLAIERILHIVEQLTNVYKVHTVIRTYGQHLHQIIPVDPINLGTRLDVREGRGMVVETTAVNGQGLLKIYWNPPICQHE